MARPARRSLAAPLAAALLLCADAAALAQLQVAIQIKRRLFVLYEPIIATVAVTNLAGRPLVLRDAAPERWFSFQIETPDGALVPPVNPDYALEPLEIPAGQTVRRSVNLTELYLLRDFGLYRVRASIFQDDNGQFYSSQKEQIEITEGKVIWQQRVGVPVGEPGEGGTRLLTLLTHRLPQETMVYARVEDSDAGLVLAMYQLGRIARNTVPQVLLDARNDLHVMQLVGPQAFVYSRVGVNGQWKGQNQLVAGKLRPTLKMQTDGQVAVIGGQPYVKPDPTDPNVPKLSDRPPGMPEE